MKELVKIEKRRIGENEVNSVDARKLHDFLEVKSEFRNWIKNRIDGYDFLQGVDFVAGKFLPGSDQKDYHLTIAHGQLPFRGRTILDATIKSEVK